MHPGELVVSTHPEQVPVLRYYLGAGYRFATTIGPVPDAQIFDWRDAVDRLRASSTQARVDQTVAAVRPGRRVRGRDAGVPRLPRLECHLDASRLGEVDGLHVRAPAGSACPPASTTSSTDEIALRHNYFKPLQAFVYRRVG